ncbi:MAG: arginase [Candidatus Berkiella sp.]
MPNKPIEIIGAGFGWGAGFKEAQFGPSHLKDTSLKGQPWRTILSPKIIYESGKTLSYDEQLQQVVDFNKQLSKEVSSVSENFPIIVGGDHSIAIGTWSGVVDAHQAQGKFGLIWVDAHMDSHTAQTTPSHHIHGMPLATLLGYGESTLVNLTLTGAKLNPADVVLIGIRSFESQEAQLLKNLNVKIYFIDEVNQRGFENVFEEAVNIVSENTKGFGVSIDIDAFDPSIAPGTGVPEPNGIKDVPGVQRALKKVRKNDKLKAIEIAEFDPTRDQDEKTAMLVEKLISALL